MNLTFKEAARGVNKDVNISISDTCPSCNGSRCQPGSKPVKCTFCNGTGMVSIYFTLMHNLIKFLAVLILYFLMYYSTFIKNENVIKNLKKKFV